MSQIGERKMCPIYEYQCNTCKDIFDVLHKMDETCEQCPTCQSEDLEQRLSSGKFVLKGDGFYKPGKS